MLYRIRAMLRTCIKAMLKEKAQRESNALEKSLEYFKLKNDRKLTHFSRRPQADTVSIRNKRL